MLQVALESLDRADEARQAITAEGLTKKTESTGAVHVHPLLKVERDCRNQFAQIWGRLKLDQSAGVWPFPI